MAVIVGAHEAPYTRHPPAERDTESYLVEAVLGAVADAGVARGEIDGLGVSSFSLRPDHAIDLAWRLGLSLRWVMEDTNGGASGLNMLQHALRALEAGDANTIVLCAGDRIDRDAFRSLVDRYNRATAEYLAPLEFGGPNGVFAFLTERHARACGLERGDYACIPIAQRKWAVQNPGAVYREAMTLEDYLAAPMVAPPLCRYDCVPVVAGADAIVLRAEPLAGAPAVRIRALAARYNSDQQEGDALRTGFADLAPGLWAAAESSPGDLDAAYLYDDYPVMVAIQATDLGLTEDGDLGRWLHARVLGEHWPLNTSGGQLSAGQAGAAGGMHGLVEAIRQLRSGAGERQLDCRLALVCGYGMVLYRHGACHVAAVLERVG
ncbi:MAG TPA: thiolase family protein [Solirubrobacteraceae bacterium]|jgi:acetyl-CoA acetyltransferase|nr:thiolase family protein [Solirubrobacteraceae bacterium]